MPKKKTALTIEERLQQALVPAEEQPYEVPENWVWVRLGAVCYASKEKSNDFSNDIKYIGLEHLEKDKGIVGFSSADKVKSTKNAFKEGQILYGRLRPYLNKHDITSFDGVCSTDILVFEATNLVANVLVDKFFNLPFFIEYVVSNSKGINLPRVSEETVLNTTFPLPPLSEQQRIVERIEELFAKLDEAKERLQEVADSFVVRKAAILHKAFTGELTKQWRRENGVSDESWEEKKLGEVGVLERGRSKHRPRNDERLFGGIYPFIQTGDVANADMFIEKHSQTLSDFGMQQSKLFAKNTICITIAANIGKVAILSYDSCFPDSVVGLTTDEKNSYKYVYYYLSTQQKELESKAPATAQKNINLKVLNDLDIPLPSLPEQHEIVRLIDDLLARERAAQQAAEQALASIDLMKKSILARAFRGELGTNKASEASALELLKQVLAEN
ncbi:restriction endonuclease subunit S [Phascolarctobacterium succinatutens]|uniref:restriction endonuclease subunit S n=1 Tax=Phascolarctobacterium succinatutens TaxID=626940 RepID=UPI00262E9EBD|nr:restriction endonuclease subunit S [uncultured Phascolarctobacterium sp.]